MSMLIAAVPSYYFSIFAKLCVLRQPYQIDGSDRTISLLGYDDL